MPFYHVLNLCQKIVCLTHLQHNAFLQHSKVFHFVVSNLCQIYFSFPCYLLYSNLRQYVDHFQSLKPRNKNIYKENFALCVLRVEQLN